MTARKRVADTHAALKEHSLTDVMHPSLRARALDDAAEGQVYRQWRMGVPVAVLAQQHGQSLPIIERIINKQRALGILGRAARVHVSREL